MMRIRTDIFVLIAMALILNACGSSAVKPSVKTAFSKDTLTIVSDGSDPAFWIFVGSSSEARQDWVRPLDKDTLIINHMGMNNSDYGGGIPCAVVWNKSECIALGSLSPVPLNINIPILKKGNTVKIWIEADSTNTMPEEFIYKGKGDCFEALRNYSELLSKRGVVPAKANPASNETQWCAWGYGRTFTSKEVIGTLPKVKELGIKWATLDDGFQIAEGDWRPNPKKFPGGDADVKALVDSIHAAGMKAMIWWAPLAADPGCKFLNEHPSSIAMDKEGKPYNISWWDSWYLSPTDTNVVAETRALVKKFISEYGFDGFKMDGQHLNCVHPDYNPAHHPDDPFYDVKHLPMFYKMIYDEANSLKPGFVLQLCPCGDCFSVYNLPYVNQTVASDPHGSWQVRTKAYIIKALAPKMAYYGDHVELSDGADDFASQLGVGAVPGTKFTWPADNPDLKEKNLLTPEREQLWKKAFGIYNAEHQSEGEMLGGLYDVGYDRPETYVIRKDDGSLYYSFFAPTFNGDVQLRGLKKGTNYEAVDLWNGKSLGRVDLRHNSLHIDFTQFELIKLKVIN
jgi:alpha-galactosidase